MTLTEESFPPGRWRASWIWADAATADSGKPEPRHTVAMRRVIELGAVPPSVPARFAAVSRATVYVNGLEVARGPIRANPRRQPAEAVDLAPHLRSGTNVIGVVSWRYQGPMPWWLPPPEFSNDLTRGAFVFEARLDQGDWLVTDASWQATVLDGWTASGAGGVSGRGRERVDARSLQQSWLAADGDEPSWPAAIVRRAVTTGEPGRSQPPSYPLGPFGLRATTPANPVDIALVPGRGPGAWETDRVVVGTLIVDVEGPQGTEVVVQTAEFTDASTGAPAPNEHDASAAFVTDGTRRRLETVDLYGLRAVVVEAGDGATVHGVTIRERTFGVQGEASFTCSDPVLDQIWAVGRRTVSLCTLDSYVDCPTREQRAWTGDSVVHQLVDLTTNTDWSMARWHPHLAASPRADGMLPMAVAGDIEHSDFTVIPDWALHWVHSVWNMYRYIGDRQEIAALLPVVEGVVRWFEQFLDDEGVPNEVYGWVIVDWASVYTEGVSATLAGLWGRSLLELAEMAEWLRDSGRSWWALRTHERLARGFERLWDPERGRYVDSMVGGVRRPMASQHGQASAIVGGLVSPDRVARLVEVITHEPDLLHTSFGRTDGPSEPNSGIGVGIGLRRGHPDPWWDVDRQVVRAQPFFRYVVHDALVAAGRADLIPAHCREWQMAFERCDTSWTETWFGGTVSHGWSSTPTRDLMTRVLGVEPGEPGFGRAAVNPVLGDLEWARGAVPCPTGLIRVDVNAARAIVDSPIPFDFFGVAHPAGRHELPLS